MKKATTGNSDIYKSKESQSKRLRVTRVNKANKRRNQRATRAKSQQYKVANNPDPTTGAYHIIPNLVATVRALTLSPVAAVNAAETLDHLLASYSSTMLLRNWSLSGFHSME